MSGEPEAVWLSDLKFALTPGNIQTTSTRNPIPIQPDPNQGRTTANLASPGVGRAQPHEQLTTEKIGEELAPDATIWQLYYDEAKEHDEELVKAQNDNLDMMLLFAALFSAILSAFLIESKNMLQQDPAGVSIALLLSIAQSQQRIEQGNPQLVSAPIILPDFVVSLSARWINGLWFFALALSLSAALIAMLAKEWLMAFTTSRPRSAHAFALLHQARLVGLNQWHALHIIDLLPSMLHLALLLFSMGLVLYLWTLDTGITAVISVIIGATIVSYVGTALLGAVYEYCPFVTHISKYTPQIFITYARSWIVSKAHDKMNVKQSHYTTDEELRALTWLADNARDPDIVDCTYMSLAGLRLQFFKSDARNAVEETQGSGSAAAPVVPGAAPEGDANIKNQENSDRYVQQYTLIPGLFEALHGRLSQALTNSSRELALRQGSDVARYALALPHIVQHMFLYWEQKQIGTVHNDKDTWLMSKPPVHAAFAALDTVWSDECPALSPDSYALLTSAELRLMITAAAPHLNRISPEHAAPGTTASESHLPTLESSREINSTAESFVEITMDSVKKPWSEFTVALSDLRARYRRTLSRAGLLIRYDCDGRTTIGTRALMHMLESVRTAALCPQLNPEPRPSAPPPLAPDLPPTIYVRVIGFDTHWVRPEDIGDTDGLLVGLLRLLDAAGIQTAPVMERAVADALGAIGRVLLKQWLKATLPHGERKESEHSELSEAFLDDWPLIEDSDSVDEVKAVLTQQVIHIAIFAVSHAGCSGIGALPKEAAHALYRRFQVATNHFVTNTYTLGARLSRLFCSADINSGMLDQDVFKLLTSIFSLKHEDKPLPQYPAISADSLPPFLRSLSRVPGQVAELETILNVLADDLKWDTSRLQGFTDSEDGFSALLSIGESNEYRLKIAKCVHRIIETAVVHSSENAIKPRAVPGAFGAVVFALKALASDEESTGNLLASTRKLLPSIRSFPPDTIQNIATSTAAMNICHNLYNAGGPPEKRANLLNELEETLGWSYKYSLPVEGLAPLFE